MEELCQQIQSWQDHRNQRIGTVNWQFRTADARIKLKRLFLLYMIFVGELPGAV
jgi:hypothetical protein